MTAERDPLPPGALEEEKRGETSEPGRPQPEAAEVESARLLAAAARAYLEPEGFGYQRIRQLADEYVARDLVDTVEDFVAWARNRGA